MQPPVLAEARTIGSLGDDVKTIRMGIDENSLEHVQMLLIDVYSDKPYAVLREYSTNARDEHVKHGVQRPIKVTLPTVMTPFLKIRDYAEGMSVETIENVYSKYGASTKRDSNKFNGMLGIGGKAGLTYTTQFTVTSVHNGEKIIVLVSRVGSVAEMKVVSQVPTTDPSGVEIAVPVRGEDFQKFAQKAKYFFSFWEKGSVLVNGQAPEPISLKMVTPNIGTTQGIGHDVIVMAGVPYPVEKRLADGRYGYGSVDIVATVPTGSVAITPSREALAHNTKSTDGMIAQIRQEFKAALTKSVQDDVNSAATKHEGYRKVKEWKQTLGGMMPDNITYNGAAFPSRFVFNYARWTSNSHRYAFSSGYNQVDVENGLNGLIITGFDVDSLSPRHKEKIRQYKSDKGIVTSFHMCVKPGVALPADLVSWIDPKRVVSFADIKAIKLPSNGPTGPRKQPTIDIFSATTGYREQAALDPNKIALYISPKQRIYSDYALRLYKAFPKVQLVELGANRWEKFTRENPGAMHVQDFLKAQRVKARDNLTKKDLIAKHMDRWRAEYIKHLPAAEVLDPELRGMIEVVNGDYKSDTLAAFDKIDAFCTLFDLGGSHFDTHSMNLSAYPLLSSARRGSIESKHMLIYVNAVWLANADKQNP